MTSAFSQWSSAAVARRKALRDSGVSPIAAAQLVRSEMLVRARVATRIGHKAARAAVTVFTDGEDRPKLAIDDAILDDVQRRTISEEFGAKFTERFVSKAL